ncbi:M20/M25/M40 family metallo-hydrolase [Pelomonas sp. V22]|uniref:M20/M25/M40 family metallo-hydrolase n=1 Tax=Pelomonas sp. V22 TaxID=2822139 RepID=UPI0024A8B671|nr:M20/M25/M40 family metallo-hydrolase [Pelomonas sp. V22]
MNRPLRVLSCVMSTLLLFGAAQAQQALTPAQAELRAIYQELVEINTTDSVGSCTKAVTAMAVHLKSAGYADADMQILAPPGKPQKGNLVLRLKGNGTKRPLLLVAHVDVVEARREDWTRDPFKLVEEGGYFYARGASDNKSNAAIYVANMMAFKRERWVPNRDIILALTCDEEIIPSPTNGVEFLLRNHRELIDAELAFDEGGGGSMDDKGRPEFQGLKVAEKIYQTFEMVATDRGGHSSVPRRDNPIFDIAEGLTRLAAYQWPVTLTPATRAYYEGMSKLAKGEEAENYKGILKEPMDGAALARLLKNDYQRALLSNTCGVTMVNAGHAQNALPQRAVVTANCRILPGNKVADVQATLQKLMGDRVKVMPAHEAVEAPASPMRPDLLAAFSEVNAELFPGVPVLITMSVATQDARFLNKAGIWTYGMSGSFRNSSGTHGLNERMRAAALYEGQAFLGKLIRKVQ